MTLIAVIFFLALAGVLYTYAGYPLLLLLTAPFTRRAASQPDPHHQPTVSLILAAYNEVETARRKLENCLALNYPRDHLEILVGSDASDDGTDDVVREFAEQGVTLHAYHPRRGKMAVVNDLVREARGEICVFSDISEVFEPDAVSRLVQHFADPRIGAVTGNHLYNEARTGLGAGTLLYWRFQRFLQRLESRLYSVFACDGTIYACRRELFPYPDDATINDDVAVPLGILRRGARVIFEPEAIARGDVLPQTQRFFHQKVRGQAGRYQNFAAFRQLLWPWPPHRWWIYVSHSVMPVLVPWLLLVLLVSNAALAQQGGLFAGLFVAQVAFYAVALAGWVAERCGVYLSLLAVPFYFVTANAGSLLGFWAWMTKTQRSTWRKVE